MPIEIDAETAVRNYLVFLEDPSKLVDQEAIAALRKQADAATDPIAKLKVLGELERAERTDGEQHRLGFVRHAKAWGAEHGVTASSFRQLGVSEEVLRAAGLVARGGSGRRGRPSGRNAQVTATTIKANIHEVPSTFTMADIASTIGGSPMTVRKAVEELVREGVIRRLGPTPQWAGRGRAPLQFQQVGKKRKP